MRTETSKTLEKRLKQSAFTTGLEELLKVAKGPMPAGPPLRTAPVSKNKPLAPNLGQTQHPLDKMVQPSSVPQKKQPSGSWDALHERVQQERLLGGGQGPQTFEAPVHDVSKAMANIGLPEARTVKDQMKKQPAPAKQTPAQPTAGGGSNVPPLPAGGGGGGGGKPMKFMRGGGMGRTLGLAGLGAAGALAYGMHRQNERDRQRNNLVYAPLPGSMLG